MSCWSRWPGVSEYPLSIWVPGKPASQGSKRIVPNTRVLRNAGRLMKVGAEEWLRLKDVNNPGYVLLLDDDESNKAWRNTVAVGAARQVGRPMLDEGVFLIATFCRVRPPSHLTSKGALSAEGKRHPTPDTRPDSIKIMRSVEDALQGVLWREDSRITTHIIRKRWAEQSGVALLVWPESLAPEITLTPLADLGGSDEA